MVHKPVQRNVYNCAICGAQLEDPWDTDGRWAMRSDDPRMVHHCMTCKRGVCMEHTVFHKFDEVNMPYCVECDARLRPFERRIAELERTLLDARIAYDDEVKKIKKKFNVKR